MLGQLSGDMCQPVRAIPLPAQDQLNFMSTRGPSLSQLLSLELARIFQEPVRTRWRFNLQASSASISV